MFKKKPPKSCSFCGVTSNDCEVLIAGPANICDRCVSSLTERLNKTGQYEETEPNKDCSFCSFLKEVDAFTNKAFPFLASMEPGSKGRKLIRGTGVSICDDCLGLCSEMIEDHQKK